MRGSIGGLASPYSFGALLPAIYQEDGLAMRLMAAFDEVLAPCVSTIDNVERYFDPALAPDDFVEMLAAWVGVELDETWPDQSRRALVAEAASLYRIRGTVAGLKRHVEIYTGAEPEVLESGGCAVSLTSGGELPGSARPELVVRVRVDDPAAVDERRLWRLVAASKPAHLPHRVEVLGRGDGAAASLAVAPEPGAGGDAAGGGEDPRAADRSEPELDLVGPSDPRQPAEEAEGPLGLELSGVAEHASEHEASEHEAGAPRGADGSGPGGGAP